MGYKHFLFLTFSLILYNIRHTTALLGQTVYSVNTDELASVICLAQYAPGHPLNHSMLCSGTLVTSTHVVTSEHCFHELGNNAVQALMGHGDIVASIYLFPIWWISFDQWAAQSQGQVYTPYNDIAILKLSVEPVNIPPFQISGISPVDLLDGMNVKIYGCGRMLNGNIPERVQVGEVTVIKRLECSNMMSQLAGYYMNVPINYMCTKSNPFLQVDRADSGGPLSFFGTFVAITAGIAPTLNGNWHPDKMNLHISIDYYRFFFDNVFLY